MESDKKVCLYIAGDPIQDIWSYGHQDGERWIQSHVEQRAGGAMNTYDNAWEIGNKLGIMFSDAMGNARNLVRLIDENTSEVKTEFWQDWSHTDTKRMIATPRNIIYDSSASLVNGMVISEYNKGGCNRPYEGKLPELEFVIVDSRYRTVDIDTWVEPAKLKIWHATGYEFEREWSTQFDYTIRTNGPGKVGIYHRGTLCSPLLEVPDTKVVDTIGAGDTFTAAIGVYLAHMLQYPPITQTTIESATRFAIWCCQNVITKPLTAICERTLREYLELSHEQRRGDTSS